MRPRRRGAVLREPDIRPLPVKTIAAVLAGPLVAAILVALLLADTAGTRGWSERKVLVPKGCTTREATRILSAAGVLRHPLAFRILVAATGTGTHLMYGEYIFPDPPSTLSVWRKMVHGEVKRYVLTVTEGANIYDIADEIGDLELLDPDEFLAAATSPAVLTRLGFAGPSAEGFLFPDTYVFVKPVTAEDVLETMLRQFRKRFTGEMATRARAEGFSVPEIVTIASIIEKETGIDEERSLVSAVIRKRLAIGMPLQMDPTVIYGLRRFGEGLTKKDLQTRNPYNTYVNRGLPPGPIANPGLGSLEAALSPAPADYLYFVSRNDGSHVFSRNLRDHNRAVTHFQRPDEPEG